MNAGAHGKEMKDIVKSVKCINYQGEEKEFTNQELQFEYRSSIFKKEKYIITEVTLELKKGKKEEIKAKMEEFKMARREKQPYDMPSAGSTVKRGKDYVTAKLIDESGLKGKQIGGAKVSEKHAGFIVNTGNATSKDILNLIELVKNIVYEKTGKRIELEIEVVGEEWNFRNYSEVVLEYGRLAIARAPKALLYF